MARRPRLALAGRPHCLLQQGVHGQPLVLDEVDQQHLLAALREAAASQHVRLWGYALLPQGLQLVACPESHEGLSRMMQVLGRRYVLAFNRRHARHGALWAGRFRAAVVEPGDWLLAALARVDRLALEAGVPGSAAHHLGQRTDPLLSEPPEYWALGNTPFERESAWRRRLEAGPGPLEAELARAVHGAWAAGSPAFVAAMAAELGRPVAPRRPGRPRSEHPITVSPITDPLVQDA
jgi:putative transposase